MANFSILFVDADQYCCLSDVVMDFEIVSTEDCGGGDPDANNTSDLTSHHPKQRQEMYVKLEQDLLSQIKMCQANRLYFKSTGEVASMNKFQVCMFYLFLERFFNFYRLYLSKWRSTLRRTWIHFVLHLNVATQYPSSITRCVPSPKSLFAPI